MDRAGRYVLMRQGGQTARRGPRPCAVCHRPGGVIVGDRNMCADEGARVAFIAARKFDRRSAATGRK